MKKPNPKAVTLKRKTKRSPEPGVNQLAHQQIKMLTTYEPMEHIGPTQADIKAVMAELGRRGGKVGGAARAAALSDDRKREIALKAARARWDK